jgi:hypothetical protein
MGARVIATGAVFIALLAGAPVALAADPGVQNLPWPNLLPPVPVSSEVQPHPVANCRRAGIACVDRLAKRLDAMYRRLDATCDHRVVPALAYLRITQALRDDLARPKPRYFTDKRYMAYVIATFSNRFFASYSRYAKGLWVPESWRIAFDAMTRGDTTAGQDVLLFSNAHVQRDLPQAYAEMGLRTPAGASRKPDHDGVNEINFLILDPVQDEVAERYDPTFSLIDAKPSPVDEYGSMELVKLWREGAWRNTERLLNARSAGERDQIQAQIEANAAEWARFIAGPVQPGYRAQRDAYCRAAKGR